MMTLRIMSLAFSLLLSVVAFAQTKKNTFQSSKDSDPAAKAILDKLKSKYNSYSALEATFTLGMKFPEMKEEIQQGKVIQQGNKYYAELASQVVVSDGKSIWTYLSQNKEVQIMDASSAKDLGGVQSPKDFLTIYEKEDFVYALVNEYTKGGVVFQEIEFKPTSKSSEYTKIRLTVDKKTVQPKSIETFNRDGSRYTMTMKNTVTNKKYPASTFVFQKAKYPGVRVVDLRVD